MPQQQPKKELMRLFGRRLPPQLEAIITGVEQLLQAADDESVRDELKLNLQKARRTCKNLDLEEAEQLLAHLNKLIGLSPTNWTSQRPIIKRLCQRLRSHQAAIQQQVDTLQQAKKRKDQDQETASTSSHPHSTAPADAEETDDDKELPFELEPSPSGTTDETEFNTEQNNDSEIEAAPTFDLEPLEPQAADETAAEDWLTDSVDGLAAQAEPEIPPEQDRPLAQQEPILGDEMVLDDGAMLEEDSELALQPEAPTDIQPDSYSADESLHDSLHKSFELSDDLSDASDQQNEQIADAVADKDDETGFDLGEELESTLALLKEDESEVQSKNYSNSHSHDTTDAEPPPAAKLKVGPTAYGDAELNITDRAGLNEVEERSFEFAELKPSLDNDEEELLTPASFGPVHLCLGNASESEALADQLLSFGIDASSITAEQLTAQHPQAKALVCELGLAQRAEQLDEYLAPRNEDDTRVPLLIIGENTDLQTRLQAVRQGSDGFLGTPLDLVQLSETLRHIGGVTEATPYRVLIMEDSKAQSRFYQKILSKAGYDCHVVNDPMQIMQGVVEFHPEIILMDMQMPGCNGIELAKVIRQQDAYQHIPIVFLSAEENEEKQQEAVEAGGEAFLSKPIKNEPLLQAVHQHVRRARNLRRVMTNDELTGLYNQNHFREQLEREVTRASRHYSPLILACIDIDGMGKINRQHGYANGDRVIRHLAHLLKQRLRKTDAMGSVSENVIGLLMPDCSLGNAAVVLDFLQQSFGQQTFTSNEGDFKVSFSAGVSELKEFDHQQLLDNALAALQQAKQQGGKRVLFARSK